MSQIDASFEDENGKLENKKSQFSLKVNFNLSVFWIEALDAQNQFPLLQKNLKFWKCFKDHRKTTINNLQFISIIFIIKSKIF